MACESEKAAVDTKKAEYNAAVAVAVEKCEADPFNATEYLAAVTAMNQKAGEVAAAVAAYEACLNNSGGGGSGSPGS